SPSAALRPAAAPSTETAATTLSGSATSLSPSASMSLHPEREPIEVLDRIRRTIGEYNFAGQYQQSPAPLGGGLVKADWFRRYRENELPERFDRIVQSWDTANKVTELSDFSVCTTWGVKNKHLFLIGVFRRRARVSGAEARGARAAEPVPCDCRADRGQGLRDP